MRKQMENNRVKNALPERTRQIKTLIVEDDPDFRQLLKEILCNHFPSMKTEGADSNQQALKKIDQCAPRLIFLDINMFDGSNQPLVKRIKKVHPETIIVALSLYDIKEYEDAALQSGADYFLAKSSLTGESIIKLVESIVSARN
jgi:DNA-binding NarL/FixJ family response regulator